jgi:hypothetical protein
MDTAAVLGNAMTDYVLAAGTNKAPAVRAPEHMAAWLEAHGYRIVRTSDIGPVDPSDRDRVAARINWGVSARTARGGVRSSARFSVPSQPPPTSAGWRDSARHPA